MSVLNQKIIHSINPDPEAKANLPEGFAQIVLGGDFSNVLDEDWYESHGFKVEKTTDPQGPYYSVLERRGDEVILHPHTSLLAAQETISQSQQQERTLIQLKGRNRNSPCRCGSGKKYKKCCGRH